MHRLSLGRAARVRGAVRKTRDPVLFVREEGVGEPLVLLHGLASSGRYWGDLASFAERHRVIVPDLLGFGRSAKPRNAEYTPAQHIAALRPALRQHAGGPFRLVGHSLGSLIALHYAATYPQDVSTLTLISLPVVGGCAWGHGLNGSMGGWHRWSVHSRSGQQVFNAGIRLAHPVWERLGPRVRRDVPPEATRDNLRSTWTSYWRSLEAVVYGTDVPALLVRLPMPLTLIHGTADQLTPLDPVRTLARAYPNVRLIEITGAGHNPYFTHRDATLASLTDSLN